jgi:subtilisin-like proprotein convertase family protein
VTVSLPTANLVSGFYTAVISTSSPDDPETGNNSYTTTFFINPSPAQPAITPAAPLICAGDSVRLETQFVTPAPAPVTVAFRSGNLAVTIPDNSPAGLIQTMAVSGIPANATITRIDVKLTATHTWVADLRFNLKAPNGKILNLFNRKGGINSVNLTNTIITSDPAAPAIPATGVPYTGTFKPDALIGIPANQGPAAYPGDAAGFADLWNVPNGNWTLAVADNAVLDGGRLDSFSITITYAIIYPNITWTPAASLFTNAATTTQYTAGTNAVFVYAEPNVNTTYTVLATTAAGCTSSNTVTVSLRQPAITFIPLPTKICLSDSAINLNAQPLGGTWAGIGVQGNRFLPPRTALGTYNVTYRYVDANNCENIDTLAVKVEDCPERRILLRDNAVIVYPNPNGGEFNIRINSTLYNKLNMGVYNSAGVLIFTQQFAGLSFNRVVPINLKHLPGGTYMVSFNYDGGQLTSEKTFKVVIAR